MQNKSRRPGKEFQEININYSLCLYCGACVGACPENAIFLHGTYLRIDASCSRCGRCVNVCPIRAISIDVKQPEPAA